MELFFICFLNPYGLDITGGSEEIRRRIETLAEDYKTNVFAVDKNSNLFIARSLSDNIVPAIYKRHLKIGKHIFNLPFPVLSRYNSNLIEDLSAKITNQPSILIVEGLQAILTWLLIPYDIRKKQYAILRLHNIESTYYLAMSKTEPHLIRKLAYQITAWQYSRLEKKILKNFDQIHPISNDETIILKHRYPDIADKIKWVPPLVSNFIDSYEDLGELTKTFKIGYFGDLRLSINLEGVNWFIQKAFPIIKQKINLAELHLAGYGSEKLSDNYAKIWGHGFISDLVEFVKDMDVIIVPIWHGAGVKIKVIDAIGFGKPLVTTPTGVEGTDIKIRDGVHVTETAEDFAGAIHRVYLHYDECRFKAKQTKAWLHQRYGPDAYRKLFNDIIRGQNY